MIESKSDEKAEDAKGAQENEDLAFDTVDNTNEEAKEGNAVHRPSRANTENAENVDDQQRDKIINLDEDEEQVFSSKKIII